MAGCLNGMLGCLKDVLHLAEKLSNDEGCQVELLDFCRPGNKRRHRPVFQWSLSLLVSLVHLGRRFSAWQSCRVADTLPPAPVPSAWENLLLGRVHETMRAFCSQKIKLIKDAVL